MGSTEIGVLKINIGVIHQHHLSFPQISSSEIRLRERRNRQQRISKGDITEVSKRNRTRLQIHIIKIAPGEITECKERSLKIRPIQIKILCLYARTSGYAINNFSSLNLPSRINFNQLVIRIVWLNA